MAVKFTLFDICALAVLLLAYSVVAGFSPEKPREMVHYVPGDALLYGEQRDATAVVGEILTSHFVEGLLERERDQGGKDRGTGSDVLHLVLSTRRWLAAVTTHPLIKDLGIDTLGLAILPPSMIRQPHHFNEDFLLDNLVVWLRPKQTITWGGDYTTILLKYSGEQGLVSSQYGRHQIRRMVVNDTSISLVMLGTTLAVSANESHLRRCIDVYDGERQSIAGRNVSWPQQQGRPWRKLFVDTVALTKVFGLAQPVNRLWRSIDTIAFQEVLNQTTSHKYLGIAYDPQPVASSRAGVLLSKSTSSPGNMPGGGDSMLWLWSNALPFSLFFREDEVAEAYSIDGNVHEGIKIIKEVAGEITDHLERESLLVADANPSNNPLALPLVVVCTRLEQPQGLLARLKQLSNFYQLSLGFVDKESLRYWYWTQSPAEGFGFLFGTYQDFFFFSNSREAVDKLFSGAKDDQHSSRVTETAAVKPLLAHFENLLASVNHKKFFATVQQLVQVLATLTAIKDRQLAAHYWQLSDGLLRPLLEGWQEEERRSHVGATFTLGRVEVEVIGKTEWKR